MFLGTYLVRVTSGNRTAVPSIFRETLGENFILAKWYENCLVLVSKSSWSALLTRMMGEERMIIKPIRETEHFIFASAYEMVPDDQGRIIIPERLAKYANLGEEIYFLGIGDRIEIWNKESWDEQEKIVVKNASDYIEELSKRNK